MILYHKKHTAEIPDLGFEPFIAPESFDRTSQPVDIYNIFNTYYKINQDSKLIFYVIDSALSTSLNWGTSYRYGYTLGGIDTVIDLNTTTNLTSAISGSRTTIPVSDTSSFPATGSIQVGTGVNFTYTSKDATNFIGASQNIGTQSSGALVSLSTYNISWSGTNRWVILNHTKQTASEYDLQIFGTSPVWLYTGPLVTSTYAAYSTNLMYIHKHDLNIETLSGSRGGYYYNNGKLTGILHLPTNTNTTIPIACFRNDKYLTSVIIPDNYNLINSSAFDGCTGLTTVTVGNGVNLVIGASAFLNCSGISSLNLGNTVKTIMTSAFQGCYSISGQLELPNTLVTIGNNAFLNCTSLTGTLTIPANVTSIGGGAFGNCNFTDIDVTANSRYNDIDNVLYEISTKTALHSIKSITTGLTLESDTIIIGAYCFSNNLRTGNLTIPTTVKTINPFAFYNCTGFTGSLYLSSNTLTYIGDYSFKLCTGLTGTLSLGNSITYIGRNSFESDNFTGALSIPNSVTTIGTEAFYNCNNFNLTLTIGTGITTIANYTFAGCNGFTRCDVYKTIAPTVGYAGLNLGGIARPLHIPTGGGTGYGIAPWTTAAVFIQPAIADL